MSWNDEKVAKLKELWGKGKTASHFKPYIVYIYIINTI